MLACQAEPDPVAESAPPPDTREPFPDLVGTSVVFVHEIGRAHV